MSLTPGAAPQPEPAATPVETRRGRLRRRLWTVCFALFAFEIGAFLVVFPWMDSWTLNHLPSFFPSIQSDFQDFWDDPLLRGAVSGLGLVNVYIAVRQILDLLFPAKNHQ
jgi:hypothetical protein